MQLKNVLFGGVRFGAAWENALYAVARIVSGAMLAFAHGSGKLPPSDKFISGVESMGFPMPTAFAWAASLAEAVGGICLILGLVTRPAAFFVGCTMITAAFVRHAPDPFDVKEKALLYLLLALIFFALGSGRYGIDAKLRA